MTLHRKTQFKLIRAACLLQTKIQRITSNKDGVAAVEFALLLPVMLILYIGTAELTTGLMANRKMTLVARTVSDLIAQETDETVGISNTTLTNIYNAASGIMSPFTITPLKIAASSIRFVPKNGAPSTSGSAS